MLSKVRSRVKTQNPDSLFRCPVKVRPTSAADFPPHLKVALVDCFVVAPDPIAALRMAIDDLRAKHFIFEEVVDTGVHEIDALEWDEYVSLNRSTFKSLLPTQDEVLRFVEREDPIFYGPFCGAPDE
jgi:hypothetical protein